MKNFGGLYRGGAAPGVPGPTGGEGERGTGTAHQAGPPKASPAALTDRPTASRPAAGRPRRQPQVGTEGGRTRSRRRRRRRRPSLSLLCYYSIAGRNRPNSGKGRLYPYQSAPPEPPERASYRSASSASSASDKVSRSAAPGSATSATPTRSAGRSPAVSRRNAAASVFPESAA